MSVLKSSSSSPNLPAMATVSKVDQATVDRGMSGGSTSSETLSKSSSGSSAGSRPSSGSRSSTGKRRDHELQRQLMRETIARKRNEVENAKLNESLTTPLCKSEEALLQDNKWMGESKDLNGSFDKIPPIINNNKVGENGNRSYFVDMK